jgi:protoporphyrinogen oxidase
MPRKAIIIGAGPAGLTAALELLRRTDIIPIVLEKSQHMGGLSRTVAYKGNRIDIGGHRFSSKSDRVMEWWLDILQLEGRANNNTFGNARTSEEIAYQGQTRPIQTGGEGPDAAHTDKVMLLRRRKSRIYFCRCLFDYPIPLSADTLSKLGMWKAVRIGFSYLRAVWFPIRHETNLEQFFINRFGRELYLTFFKSYTEKVWGIACDQIIAEWGAQRTKGLSIRKTITHFVRQRFRRDSAAELAQKNVETSLIEQLAWTQKAFVFDACSFLAGLYETRTLRFKELVLSGFSRALLDYFSAIVNPAPLVLVPMVTVRGTTPAEALVGIVTLIWSTPATSPGASPRN